MTALLNTTMFERMTSCSISTCPPAAKYMIYSASNVFEFCNRERTLLRHLWWGEMEGGFKEAQTNPLINASRKKHATLAVAAMNEAEKGLNRRQGLRGIDWANHKRSRSDRIQ